MRRGSRSVGTFFLSVVAVIVLLLSVGGSIISAAPDRVDVIIAFKSQPGQAEEALVRAFGGTVKGTYNLVPAIAASVPSAALEGLRHHPLVALVEPDIQVEAVDLSDGGTADTSEVANAWGIDRLDASLVWSTTNGSGVGVAIVDTGSGPHVDLPNALARLDCLSGACVSGGNDDNGHGTHVAGSALASQNGSGVVGVAPGASLFSYKVLNSSGSGSYSNIIAALDHIVKYNASGAAPKILVANFSLGSGGDPGTTVKAAFDNAYASGILIVGAAGNSGNPRGRGNNVIYPAKYDSVLAVAATEKNDSRASFSSTGPDVELAAPGVSINSAWLNNGYRLASGTSMATPHVTGAAALVIAAGIVSNTNGVNGIADEVRSLLDSTAKDLGSAGRDSQYGYGLVNPQKAITGSNSHY